MLSSVYEANYAAWNQNVYEAWIQRFGTPKEAAEKIVKNPLGKLTNFFEYLEVSDIQGKKIMNLMGSHGMKAISLALLGADVTIVDFSEGNARYARELAEAAGVRITYIVKNVLDIQDEGLLGTFDYVFSEFGILHYFTDLSPYFAVVTKLLNMHGRMILQDFHPVSTKLISSRGTTHHIRKHKVTGDYFDTSVEETDISFSKYVEHEDQLEKVKLRKWTLGEIVTSIANAGLMIRLLHEHPNLSSDVFDKGIPKSFTIAAEKIPFTI